jgi:hypothetical protein
MAGPSKNLDAQFTGVSLGPTMKQLFVCLLLACCQRCTGQSAHVVCDFTKGFELSPSSVDTVCQIAESLGIGPIKQIRTDLVCLEGGGGFCILVDEPPKEDDTIRTQRSLAIRTIAFERPDKCRCVDSSLVMGSFRAGPKNMDTTLWAKANVGGTLYYLEYPRGTPLSRLRRIIGLILDRKFLVLSGQLRTRLKDIDLSQVSFVYEVAYRGSSYHRVVFANLGWAGLMFEYFDLGAIQLLWFRRISTDI